MHALLLLLVLLGAAPLAAQQAAAPDRAAPGFRLGLFGFGARAGLDLDGDADLVLGYSLDVADLYLDRLRLRPSAEVGLRAGANTYVGNLEVVYRFTPDSAITVPYVGAGLGVQGHETCPSDPQCPNLWAQFALGFELPFREQFSWLLEYHGEDGLRRHRLFVGLVTRRGS